MKAAENEKTVSHQRREEYLAALIQYLKKGDEDCLYRLYELSKIFKDEGVSPGDILALHIESLEKILADGSYPCTTAVLQTFKAFLEVISPYEMAFGHYVELKKLNLLQEVGMKLNFFVDMDSLCQFIVDKTTEMFKMEDGCLYRKDRATGGMTFRTTKGKGLEGAARDRFPISIPLKTEKEEIGEIRLARGKEKSGLDEMEKQMASILANQFALALERLRLYESLREQSVTDGLTEVFNVRYFHEVLEKEIQRARRYQRALSLVIMDIDSLKKINDSYGHLAGDTVIKDIARLIKETVREADIIVRYGGDEFVVIMPETDKKQALEAAVRILDKVREHRFEVDGGFSGATLSAGVADYTGGDMTPELLKMADEALYQAKAEGRDRACLYDLSYCKLLVDYLRTGQEADLYQVAQFGKEMMNKGMGPESIVEMHLDALKKINKAEKTYAKEVIDESFTVLMEGIMSYGMAYKEFFNSRTEGYLAEIKELIRMLSERLAGMTALYETVKVTVSSLDLDEVLSSVFNNAVKTLKADAGSLMLLDPEEGVLTIKKAHGLDEEVIRKTRIKIGEGIAGRVARSGEPMVFHGKVNSPQVKGRVKYDKVNSICAPLKSKKGVIGIVNLNRQADSEPFTEENLKLLSTMAHEAASAIENAGLYKDLHESYLSTIRALASAIEVKDLYTKGHSDAVARCAVKIAKRLDLSPYEIEGIEVAGILYDVGNIGIQEEILNKPGKLDDEEWKEVKKHPESSMKILGEINFPWDIKPIIYAHHERYDGNGYPNGLKGEEIPLGARILGVADLYDAMTSDRAYRKGLSNEVVIEELKRVSGTQLDPEIGKVFIEMLLQGEIEK